MYCLIVHSQIVLFIQTEILRYCPLSCRQQILYNRLRNKIRLEDLSSVIGSADQVTSGSNEAGPPFSASSTVATHLINLVMQLRKVCNHPDLWEPRDVRFSCFHGAFLPTDHERSGASRTRNHHLWLPRLLYDEGRQRYTRQWHIFADGAKKKYSFPVIFYRFLEHFKNTNGYCSLETLLEVKRDSSYVAMGYLQLDVRTTMTMRLQVGILNLSDKYLVVSSVFLTVFVWE